ncbi:hypothetical protein NYE48_27665 [Paenibacillus sp. FSL M7-1455]|uniref:hypothetical protein n=1 Tax=Paenibacillus sp. FSL M7-1455 TaxID=2975316 RepID=UPI0030F5F6D3
MSAKPSKLEEIQQKVRSGGGSGVHGEFLSSAAEQSTSTSAENGNDSEYVSVNVDVPVRKRKPKFEDTHRRKTFWIANDIADMVDEEIRNDRGAMTQVINALLREYFAKRKQ